MSLVSDSVGPPALRPLDRKERQCPEAFTRGRPRDREHRADRLGGSIGRAGRETRRHLRPRDLDRRRLHRPAASYYGETWKLEAATACKPRTGGTRKGRQVPSRRPRSRPACRSSPATARPTPSRSSRASGSRTAARQRAELRRRVQPLRQPADAVDGRAVPRHRAGRPGRDRREGAHHLRRPCERQQARRPADEGVARLPRPADDAVHAGDRPPRSTADRRERDQPVRVVRPLLLEDPGPLDHAQAEPALQGRPRRERRHDPGQRRQRRRGAVPERRARDVGLRLDRHPGHRVAHGRPEVRAEPQGRARAGSVVARRPVRRDEPRAAAVQGQPGLAKAVNWAVDRQAFSAQGGYLYGKRTGRSSLRGSSATSRRGSTRCGSRPTRSSRRRSWPRATSAAATRCSGRRTRGRHRSRRS